MSKAPYQIIAGPANVFVAPYATAFPDVGAAYGSTSIANWTYLGKTEGGVKVSHAEKLLQITGDQATGPLKAVRTEEGLQISFSLLELTLEHYAIVMNNASVTTTAAGSGGSGITGNKSFKIHQGFDVSQWAFLVRGPSPYYDGSLQYQVPLVVQNAQPKTDFQRTKSSLLDCEFLAIEDYNAAAGSEFGVILAQTGATP